MQQVPGLWKAGELEYASRNGVHDQNDKDNNLRRLYSAGGFRAAWTQYQQAILNGLNQRTAERAYPREIKAIALQTARNPAEAAIFNHASMAFNNHFYFKGISTSPDQEMDPRLRDRLVTDFGSLDNLKAEMLAMAEAMFGPGFVWLVRVPGKTGVREFRLLATYLAGSPFAGAHNRRQPIDMNTQNVTNAIAAGGVEALSKDQFSEQHLTPQNHVGAFGKYSAPTRAESLAYGGVDVLPCLCVSTWEHSYMLDWRFNKRDFLQRWWMFIDWNVVADNADIEGDAGRKQAQGRGLGGYQTAMNQMRGRRL